MKEAFAKQLANKDYQRFLEKVPRVEGVWDDHDYGGKRNQGLSWVRRFATLAI